MGRSTHCIIIIGTFKTRNISVLWQNYVIIDVEYLKPVIESRTLCRCSVVSSVIIVNFQFFSFRFLLLPLYLLPVPIALLLFRVISCACYLVAPFSMSLCTLYLCVYYVIHLFHFDIYNYVCVCVCGACVSALRTVFRTDSKNDWTKCCCW